MKKTISIFAAFAAFAVFGVTPNTEWQDVPGTDKVGEVLSAGGAVTTEQDPVWNAQKGNYQPKLVSGTNIKTVNGNSLLGNGNIEIVNGNTNSVNGAARPLPKYLHALDFDDTYPDDAAWYYAQPQPYGSCSARRVGNTLERNYDWKFDDAAEFVVRMSAANGRFASVGVANCGTNLTENIVTSGKWSRYYKCLPGRVVDGINEHGVVAEVNVVDGEPPASTGGDIHPLAAVRWALDNGTSAEYVATSLAARVAFPAGWTQNFHWMIADETSTWIVENGSAHAVTDGVPVMTNFRLYPTRDTSGAGQERYDLLAGGAAITNAWFTRAYLRTTDWASDFDSAADMEAAKVAWETHTREQLRGKGLWQTLHSSIYDITNKTLRIAVQETPDWYTFSVPSAGTDEDEVRRIAGEVVDEKMPVKWALSNVTNAQGQVVNAEDVGAYAVDETIRVNGAQVPYGNRAYSTYGAEGVVIKPEEVGGRTGGGWLKWNELKLGGDGDSRTGDALTLKKTNGLFNFTIAPAVGSEFAVYLPTRGGNIALTSDIPAPYVPSAADPTFSNAVLAVGLNIDTNSVAVLNEIAATFGDFPLGPGETATTIGGLLAALAAAVAWLKKNKLTKGMTGGVPDDPNVSALFSAANTSLAGTIEAKVNAMFDNGETEEF